MGKERFIFSAEANPKERREVDSFLAGLREKGLKPMDGEIEKTPEEIRFIERVNSYLQQEFNEMGIEERVNIPQESIHLLSHEAFLRDVPDRTIRGATVCPDNTILIDKEEFPNRLDLYVGILHESVHLLSFQETHIKLNRGVPKKYERIANCRSGYAIKDSVKGHLLEKFGESVIDKTVIEVLKKHKEELIRDFSITEEETARSPVGYTQYLDVLDAIIKGVAKDKNQDESSVWQEIKKGHFTGETASLTDIEAVFGKDSLRVLGALGYEIGDEKSRKLSQKEVFRQALRYFKENDEEQRKQIASQILQRK